MADITLAELDALEKLAEKATPFTETDLMRYEHGGGRLALLNGQRHLIADFYHEDEREYFTALTPATILRLCAMARKGMGE